MSRILVIDDDSNLLQMVKLMLERVGHDVALAKDGQKGIQMAGQTQPDLAIIDVMMPGLSGYDVVRKLRQDPLTARIPIIILTARSQPMDKEMALEAGANAFLSKPVTAQELTERVDAVIRAGVDYRVHTGLLTEPIPPRQGTGAPPSRPVQPPPPAADGVTTPPVPTSPPAPAATPRPAGRLPIGAEDLAQPTDGGTRLPVTTVISLRGGTGCTTIAVNLALALATDTQPVCLADLSTVGGHAQLHLHLKPQRTWQDLAAEGELPDPARIQGALTVHDTYKLALLAAPARPQDSTLSTPAIQKILRSLSGSYKPVVVDARHLDAATKGALEASSAVVLVMTDDPPSVQTASQLLAVLGSMGLETGRIRVVLNHVRPSFDVPADAIQKALKRPISVDVPFDPNQPNAIRRGVPLVKARPESPFAQRILQLARSIRA